MAKNGVVVVVLAGGALAIASGSSPPCPRPSQSQSPRRALVETDHRRLQPGVHRSGPAELAVRNRVAQAESAKLQERARLRARLGPTASVPATAWVSLGPTNALDEFNGVEVPGVDSGRLNTILVDPRDPNVVYLASSGGGVWKTFDFRSASGPTWAPASDTLPNLASGALAMDAENPDTLYLVNGDFIDGSGNTILKSVDGGSTWGTPVVLPVHPLFNGSQFGVGARAVRALTAHGSQVLVGTDVGLYASSNGGASFTPIDLPNVNGALLTESIWSIVPTGNGHFVASGVHGCDSNYGPPLLAQDVDPGQIDPATGAACAQGANGEIWFSANGVSWTRAATPTAIGIGRLTLAAGAASDPASAVVYAYVGSTDGFTTAGFWRSMNGGVTWADATGTLLNPTLDPGGGANCGSVDLGHDQTWYN